MRRVADERVIAGWSLGQGAREAGQGDESQIILTPLFQLGPNSTSPAVNRKKQLPLIFFPLQLPWLLSRLWRLSSPTAERKMGWGGWQCSMEGLVGGWGSGSTEAGMAPARGPLQCPALLGPETQDVRS